MRIGLIADIHGNLLALDTVLAHLATEHVDEIICLGDVAALGPHPTEVLARLRGLGCAVVMGNTDAWLLHPPPFPNDPANVAQRDITDWAIARLSSADREYIHAFAPTLTRTLGYDEEMLCFHGSPRSDDEVIIATTPESDLDLMCGETRATILIGAHTHIQMVRSYRGRRLINVGSVGLPGIGAIRPYNPNVHWAEYAVVDAGTTGLEVSLRRVALDIAAMIADAHMSRLPHVDWWAGTWNA